MKLDEVAERFALDSVFTYYPNGARLADLIKICGDCTDFFSHDEWLMCEQYEEYAYVSSSAVIGLVMDEAESFKRYYEMVGE